MSGDHPGRLRRNAIQERLQRQLDRAEGARQNQNVIVWTVFSIFAAALAVLVGPLIELKDRPAAGLALSVVGLVMSSMWSALLARSIRFLSVDEVAIRNLEDALEIESPFSTTKRNPSYKRILGRTWRAKRLAQSIACTVTLCWFLATIYFFAAFAVR